MNEIRAVANFTPEGGASTQSIEYILRLPEGVTLRLLGSNRQGDEGFVDLMGAVARSLSR
ncbi:MAG TPA: hypothetical protein VFS43_29625 [Polyangiaceae bacterium]|nr:hypothetical protein [Polyangiaceae bacterium]